MNKKFYPEELKAQAVRLVVERRLSATEASAQLGLRSEVVRLWVRRFRNVKKHNNGIRSIADAVARNIEREALIRLAAQLLDKAG